MGRLESNQTKPQLVKPFLLKENFICIYLDKEHCIYNGSKCIHGAAYKLLVRLGCAESVLTP